MGLNVLNIMLARGKGGIEQAAIDYSEALQAGGHAPINVLHPEGWCIGELPDAKPLKTLGGWDFLAASRLKTIARDAQADVAICHGNRAISMALKAFKGRIPIIAVAHNYNIKRFPKCDGALSITRDLIEELVHLDMPREQLFHMPNLVRPPASAKAKPFANPVRIKTMGRFVEKKGFRYFIDALAILKQRNIAFEAEIGGDGMLRPLLHQQAEKRGLSTDELKFSGWVKDKDAFWKHTDIFVLPSLHEPFGIVLIEAMSHALPCVTTDSEGPCEIIANGKDALLAQKASASAIADALQAYIEDPLLAAAHAKAAREKVLSTYTTEHAAERLNAALAHFTQT